MFHIAESLYTSTEIAARVNAQNGSVTMESGATHIRLAKLEEIA